MKSSELLGLIFSRLKGFARSESGMTLPLLAFSMIALTSFTGIAIDVARMQMVQSKLQFSLDAAGLAAGSTASTANLTTEVNKYMNVNFNGYLDRHCSLLVSASIPPRQSSPYLLRPMCQPLLCKCLVYLQ